MTPASATLAPPSPSAYVETPTARWVVVLRDRGERVHIASYEWQPGVLHADVVCTRIEFDNERRVSWPVFDHIEHRMWPASSVREVREVRS